MADVIWDEVALRRYVNGPNGGVARSLFRRGLQVESAAKIAVSGAYPPPSYPGEPPHLRSGRLRASISTALGEDALGLFAAVGTNLDYGRYLELGTDRMAARPFLLPSLKYAA